MTPEIIKTISKLRNDFYTSFAAAMEEPVKISGNSYNSLSCIASWVDRNHWLNYITIYAYLSPDELATERPFILRLSINKGAGTITLPRHGQTCQGSNQQWTFEITILPEELLDFLPWIVDLANAQAEGMRSFTQAPPHPLNSEFMVSLRSAQLWTLAAEQLMEAQKLIECSIPPVQSYGLAETPDKLYKPNTTQLSSRRLLN